MPQAWEHAVDDLMVFGRSYFDLHQDKEAPCAWLGRAHRELNHEWYNAAGVDWTPEDPFPATFRRVITSIAERHGAGEAEEAQSYTAHGYLDWASDHADHQQRAFRRVFLAWIVRRPDLLKSHFGVDVENGRIHRVIDGRPIWEDCPELPYEYDRLRAYVEAVLRNDDRLRAMVDRYS